MARWTISGGKLIPVTGPHGPGFRWRGDWQDTATYKERDIVHYQGNTYIALEESINEPPTVDATPTSFWDTFLEGGTGGGTIGDEDSVFLQSPDETLWRIFINDDGVLETEVVSDNG